MIKKTAFGKFLGIKPINDSFLNSFEISNVYGAEAFESKSSNPEVGFIFSQSKAFDLIELEQLLQSVGWSRRPIRRVKKALDNSLLKVGVWRHDPRFPRLVGFARCTGDGVIDATVWDVAIHPVYQGSGLGKELMNYILAALKDMGISRVTLFADPGVVSFYRNQGWTLEPRGNRCAFWYAN
ncbi:MULTISPECIES: GNAT family N-acetyltransferase [Prochlorococcus]|uniref:GNAT family N-acetyltransferase n=1 Tax=Prochlorococcus TaxID=1218 RepID=UPI000533961C|nr:MULTISPECIES: GNAT family N-acetyltransferase [Prochlorococcus]KGG12826.1 N-acetyltransferase (GNAT) family [Prochlorococcus sp. MIT 0601]